MPKTGVFLRAVNLSGRRLLMEDFRRALAEAGYPGARTVVATGNAVIDTVGADAALESSIEQGLAATLGQSTDVFVRTGAELAAIVAANPFPDMAREDPSHLVVVFLKSAPSADAIDALRARIKGPEEIAAGPRCLYARYPDDIGHSKLTAALIERALKLRGTARNWNTVLKVAELTRDP